MGNTVKTPGETKRIRVRYSRLSKENRTPKNTLVTVQDGDTVYFGISRCNRKLDTFHKNIGTYIATKRMKLVNNDDENDIDMWKYDQIDNSELFVHSSNLRGWVPVEDVKLLIRYFRVVDEHCLDLVPKSRAVGV